MYLSTTLYQYNTVVIFIVNLCEMLSKLLADADYRQVMGYYNHL